MKVVVLGGTGFIGGKLVDALRRTGHEVLAASPSRGVNTITGEGLAEALAGASVVVDVTNSPSLEGDVALDFFRTSTRNLVAAAQRAGLGHYAALSIVGADRLDSGYFQAKVAQETLIRESSLPYTIVRSTQFFEFIDQIVKLGADGDAFRLPRMRLQPILSDDAVEVLSKIVTDPPVNAVVEIAGPEIFTLAELAAEVLEAGAVPHRLIVDDKALYFGASGAEDALIPGPGARILPHRFGDWQARKAAIASVTPRQAAAAPPESPERRAGH